MTSSNGNMNSSKKKPPHVSLGGLAYGITHFPADLAATSLRTQSVFKPLIGEKEVFVKTRDSPGHVFISIYHTGSYTEPEHFLSLSNRKSRLDLFQLPWEPSAMHQFIWRNLFAGGIQIAE